MLFNSTVSAKAPLPGRRLRNGVIATIGIVATVFVLSTAWQIIRAVFDLNPEPLASSTAEDDCAHQIRSLEAALDRGAAAATRAKGEAAAEQAFADELLPEWSRADDAEATCKREPNGTAAWSALLQLRRGLEGRARHDANETASLRKALHERLP